MKNIAATVFICALILYATIACIGFVSGWIDCSQAGGEYMRTIIGNWRCVE